MSSSDLHKLLTDSGLRAQASKSEILELIKSYPYSLNLHYLLLEKLNLESGEEFTSTIKKVSGLAIDRRFLKRKVEELMGQEEKVEIVEGPIRRRISKKKVKSKKAPLVTQVVRVIEKNENLDIDIKEQRPDITVIQEEELLQNMAKKDKNKDKEVQKSSEESKKDSFEAWLASLQASIKSKEAELEEKKKPKKKKKKKKKSKKKKKKKELKVAKVSLAEDEGVVSETLADLLAKQGYIEKARHMYHKLSLLFPEKSTYFAGKIENLKNN